MSKKIVLSGAITGHLEEAKEYFAEAKRAVFERWPNAQVFDPTTIPSTVSWDDAMTICKTRIRGWATDIVCIKNDHYSLSEGSAIECDEAKKASLLVHTYEHGRLIEAKEIPG